MDLTITRHSQSEADILNIIDLTALSLPGRVLDIGGGGEGIIARCIGNNVIAIDLRAGELAETPDIGVKVIMDACDLKFINHYFDYVTCFYSLMYMEISQIKIFLQEAYRVMKPGAKLLIWDAHIPALPDGDIFETHLQVKIDATTEISVGYGVMGAKEQHWHLIETLGKEAGFDLESAIEGDEAFHLQFTKSEHHFR